MKKPIVILLSFLLLAALAGCGQQDAVTYYEKRTYHKAQTGDITRSESTYDENWNLLLHHMTLNGSFTSKTEYAYNEDYTILTTTSTSADSGEKTSTIVRTFDEKGQIIKSETYEGDLLVHTGEYTYDDNGEKTFVKATYPEDNTVITVQRSFDDAGNLISYIQDTGYSVHRYEYGYNQKNQRIREEYYRDDELQDYTEYVWEGNVGTGTSYHADGTHVGKRVLEYDDHGNLLRLESQHPTGITLSVSCYEYIGTDGSISSGIPE